MGRNYLAGGDQRRQVGVLGGARLQVAARRHQTQRKGRSARSGPSKSGGLTRSAICSAQFATVEQSCCPGVCRDPRLSACRTAS